MPERLIDKARQLVSKVGDWVEPFLKIAAVLSGIFSILFLWVAKDELHLLVWIEEDTVIYPAKSTDNLSLPLEFEKHAANSVRIIKAKVMNYGKQTIGKPETLWNLDLEGPAESSLTLIKKPTAIPTTTILDVIDQQPASNVLTFQLGAFQPRSAIDIHLLLVNAPVGPPLKVKTSLAGMPREITTEKPITRLAVRILVWTVLFSILTLAIDGVPLAVDAAKQLPSNLAKVRVWLVRGLFLLALGMFGGTFLAFGLAYVILWFL